MNEYDKKVTIKFNELEDLVNDVLALAGVPCDYDEQDTKFAYENAKRIDKWLDTFRADKLYG